jgi:inosine/xanthosine triphosphate pyrophosphatase family protein
MIKSRLRTHGQPEMPQSLVFVTGNANKLAEVQAILGDAVPSLTNKALDLPELQGTIEEITLDKARRAAEEVGCLLFRPSTTAS